MNQAQALLLGLQIWCSIGAFVSFPFLVIGIDRIDEDARGAYVFRLLYSGNFAYMATGPVAMVYA